MRSLLPTSCRRKKPEPVRASHVALLCHATTVYLGRSDKERKTGGRVSTAMPAVRTLSLASRDVAQLTRSRFTPLGYRVNDAQSRSTFAKASFKCWAVIIVYTAPVVPLLRLELAHVFTLRTECHPENKCPLNPVVRSSGLILAFLKSQPETSTARRQHGAPSPTRRANTARRCGRLVAPPTTFYTHFGHTRVVHKVRGGTTGWWWAQRKRDRRTGQHSNARRAHT